MSDAVHLALFFFYMPCSWLKSIYASGAEASHSFPTVTFGPAGERNLNPATTDRL